MEAILFIDQKLLSTAQQAVYRQLIIISEFRSYLNKLLDYYAKLDSELRTLYLTKHKKIDKKYVSTYKQTGKKIKREIENVTFHLQYLNNQLIELSAADIINENSEVK
jgi:hypothetical protein